MIPIFNGNFYKDVFAQDFHYEPCFMDGVNEYYDDSKVVNLNEKIKNIAKLLLSDIEWTIRYCVSIAIYPLLDYATQRKCEIINSLSRRSLYANLWTELRFESAQEPAPS